MYNCEVIFYRFFTGVNQYYCYINNDLSKLTLDPYLFPTDEYKERLIFDEGTTMDEIKNKTNE